MVRRRSTVRFRKGAPAQSLNSNIQGIPWGQQWGLTEPQAARSQPYALCKCSQWHALEPTSDVNHKREAPIVWKHLDDGRNDLAGCRVGPAGGAAALDLVEP